LRIQGLLQAFAKASSSPVRFRELVFVSGALVNILIFALGFNLDYRLIFLLLLLPYTLHFKDDISINLRKRKYAISILIVIILSNRFLYEIYRSFSDKNILFVTCKELLHWVLIYLVAFEAIRIIQGSLASTRTGQLNATNS
jgi:hypothetical protein